MCHQLEKIDPVFVPMGPKQANSPHTRQIVVRVDAGIYEALRASAEQRGLPLSALLRGALAKAVA